MHKHWPKRNITERNISALVSFTAHPFFLERRTVEIFQLVCGHQAIRGLGATREDTKKLACRACAVGDVPR